MKYFTAIERLQSLYEAAGNCEKCDAFAWEYREVKNKGGHTTFPLFCAECDYKRGIYVPKVVVTAIGDKVPEWRDGRALPRCEVCSEAGAEEHHWAPWAIFGDESARWPRGFLCQACHARWHQLVTPQSKSP